MLKILAILLAAALFSCSHKKNDQASAVSTADMNQAEQTKYIKQKLAGAIPLFMSCIQDKSNKKSVVLKFQLLHTLPEHIEVQSEELSSEEKGCFKNALKELKFPLALDTKVSQPMSFGPRN